MRPLKDAGLQEVQQLRRRVRRQHAMDRIGQADFDFLDGHLNEVEARIVSMQEFNEYGKEA
jgi:hypothetical protein